MAVSYTQGNWTVTSKVPDSTQTALTITAPQLDPSCYAISMDEPDDVRYNDVTSSGLASSETLRYGRSDIKDVYSTDTTPSEFQMSGKAGEQALVELTTHYHATNSVSGAEVDIPLKTWVVVKCPTNELVTSKLVNDAMLKLIGMLFSNDGTTLDRLTDIIRGKLRL